MHANLFHLGPLHIPMASIFLAAGLVAALLLSQRTASRAGLDPESMWDFGLVAAISAFVISRLLLVFTNLGTFVRHPVLLLSVPSFTTSGLLLTAVFLFFYLRRKRLPIPSVLDAAAAPLALLWAFLSLGSFAAGSLGMPTTLPWAVRNATLGPIHPVELYAGAAALALFAVLNHALPAAAATPGKTAATGLFLAGSLLFFLDFLTQPAEVGRLILIDPIQWIALAMLLTGVFSLLSYLSPKSAHHVAHRRPSSSHAV